MNNDKSAKIFPIQLILFSFILALAALLLVLFGKFLGEKTSKDRSVIDNEEPSRFPFCVVIDAGHGGEDGGAVSRDGVLEKDINLELSRVLCDLFAADGISVRMTRTEDKMLYDRYPELDPKGKKKMLDLRARVDAAAETDGAILLSIHMNTYPDASCRGTQVYYSQNHAESYNIAGKIQTYVAENLQKDNKRKIKAAGDNIFLLYRSECPAVLVECGFLSNPEETKLLCDGTYQKKLACAIFASLADYMSAR